MNKTKAERYLFELHTYWVAASVIRAHSREQLPETEELTDQVLNICAPEFIEFGRVRDLTNVLHNIPLVGGSSPAHILKRWEEAVAAREGADVSVAIDAFS
jgi:hypothetical protein